jgi:plasmid stability protein
MSMIQIRNVPDQLHRELKSRAALNGMTLSDYLLDELRAIAARPTMKEWLARTENITPIESDMSTVEALALERAEGAE